MSLQPSRQQARWSRDKVVGPKFLFNAGRRINLLAFAPARSDEKFSRHGSWLGSAALGIVQTRLGQCCLFGAAHPTLLCRVMHVLQLDVRHYEMAPAPYMLAMAKPWPDSHRWKKSSLEQRTILV